MKLHRNPPGVPVPVAAYSQQVEVREPARWLVLSGQLGQREDGSTPNDPIEQLDAAFKNVITNLRAAQMEARDLVKLTIYLVGDFDMQRRRAVISKYLEEPYPCVTMVKIAGLFDDVHKVEIEAWACQ